MECPCALELTHEGGGSWREGDGEYVLETELGLGDQLSGRRCNEHNDDPETSCLPCESLELEVASGAWEEVLVPDLGFEAISSILTLAPEQPLRLLGPTPTQPGSDVRSSLELEARCVQGGQVLREGGARTLQLTVQTVGEGASELWLRADAGVEWEDQSRVKIWSPFEGAQAPGWFDRVHPDQTIRWERAGVGELPAVRFGDPTQNRRGGLEANEASWYLNSEQGPAQGMTLFFVAQNEAPRADRSVLLSNCGSRDAALEMGGGDFQIGFGSVGGSGAQQYLSLISIPPQQNSGATQYELPPGEGFRLLTLTLDSLSSGWSLHVDGALVMAGLSGTSAASTERWNLSRLFGTCMEAQNIEFQGSVAEVLIRGEPLEQREREQVEAYLRLKYQLGER